MNELDNWKFGAYPWCVSEYNNGSYANPDIVLTVGRHAYFEHKHTGRRVEFYEYFCGTGVYKVDFGGTGARKVEWSTRHGAQQCADTLNAGRTWKTESEETVPKKRKATVRKTKQVKEKLPQVVEDFFVEGGWAGG